MPDPVLAPLQEVIIEKPILIDTERVFVVPPMTRIGSGPSQLKAIKFRNQTGKPVRIWLPNAYHYLNATANELALPFEIPNGEEKQFTLKAEPKKGYYPYHVFCEAIGNDAEGHSEPSVGCP